MYLFIFIFIMIINTISIIIIKWFLFQACSSYNFQKQKVAICHFFILIDPAYWVPPWIPPPPRHHSTSDVVQHDDDAVPGLCGEYRWYGDTHRHLTQPRLLRGHQGQVPWTAHQVRIFRSNDGKKKIDLYAKISLICVNFPLKSQIRHV